MNDIKPPKPSSTPPRRPQPGVPDGFRPRSSQTTPRAPQASTPTTMPPVMDTPSHSQPMDKKKRGLSKKMWVFIVIDTIIVALLALGVGGYMWYTNALEPRDSSDTGARAYTVVSGASAKSIANDLEKKGIIKSAFAFEIYAKLNGVGADLQAGAHTVSPSQSVKQVIASLGSAKKEQVSITLYPGATLYDPTIKDDKKRTDVFTMLQRAGYQDNAIKQALARQYDHPLFAGKPQGASLEGYVYGETYFFEAGASLDDVLTTTFDEYNKALKEMEFAKKVKKQGLTQFEAITLASIVQREVSDPDDMKTVAGVFYNRLAQGIMLGSDVTFIYAARQKGDTPRVNYPSPYNTRVNAGLPPGPIATPGKAALEAVAEPETHDYIYFVAGDDGKTYFSKTEAEHEANARKHCIKLCAEF